MLNYRNFSVSDLMGFLFDNYDKNGVIIIDGIAGSAKTSTVVRTLKQLECPYLHTTSTNKLRNNIRERFGGDPMTVAAGLFDNEDGFFYKTGKDVETRVIIIDEILQTSVKIFQWIRDNCDHHLIIICTDSRQMLSPGGGSACLQRLKELKQDASIRNLAVISMTDSLRAADWETQQWYIAGYNAEPDEITLFPELVKTATVYNVEDLQDIAYSPDNAYIVHDNHSERLLYDINNLRRRYDLDLIQKGSISAADPKDPTHYPIMPQEDAMRRPFCGYWQVSNIGTVIRFQGTETDHKIFFICRHGAKITNRECYTMITRAKHINDIIIVFYSDRRRDIPQLKTFRGKPVLKSQALEVQHGITVLPADTQQMLQEANSNAEITGVWYTCVVQDGHVIKPDRKQDNSVSLESLIRKEPELELTRPNMFYRQCERVMLHYGITNILPPGNMDADFGQWKYAEQYQYVIDLYSSYPHCMYNRGLPDGRTYSSNPQDGSVKIYMTISTAYGQPGMIIMQPLYDYLHNDSGYTDAVCIGSCDFMPTKTGDYLYQAAHNTVESKQSIKGLHYGYMARQYYEGIRYNGCGEPNAYIVSQRNLLFLAFCAIQSEQALVMHKLKRAIYGNTQQGKTYADSLYFDGPQAWEQIAAAVPGYYFRVMVNTAERSNKRKPVIWSNCPDLPTKKEQRNEKNKLRRREQRKNAKNQKQTAILQS